MNIESVFKSLADALSAEAPLGFAIITIVFAFSIIIRFYDLITESVSFDIPKIKKDIKDCEETITEMEKKYPLLSPCDFHTDCRDCHLYDTAFCWKNISEKECKINER